MKIRETVLQEVGKLGPAELMKLNDLLRSLQTMPLHAGSGENSGAAPYLEVQNALSSIYGSLTDDVVADREERL